MSFIKKKTTSIDLKLTGYLDESTVFSFTGAILSEHELASKLELCKKNPAMLYLFPASPKNPFKIFK